MIIENIIEILVQIARLPGRRSHARRMFRVAW